MPKLRPTPEHRAISRFNEFVRDAMVRHNMTQTELAKAIGIDQSGLSKRFKHKYRWELTEMFRVCELFGEDFAILEGGK